MFKTKFVAIFAALLCFTSYAHAVGSLIVTAIAGSAFAATAAGVVIATVINFAVAAVVSRAFAPSTDTPDASTMQDSGARQQLPPATTNDIAIVYGDAYLGGTFVDAVLSNDQKVMYYVMAISCISPNGQFSYDTSKFYYGDRLCTMSGADVVALTDGAGNVDTKINGNLQIYLYTSTDNGVITPHNTSAMPHEVMGGSDIASGLRWTHGNRQMNGLAFAIVRLTYNTEVGTTQLQPVTYYVSHYLNNIGKALPGDVFVDYLNSPRYGGAVDIDSINLDSAAALNAYGLSIIYYIDADGNPAVQSRYLMNGVLNAGKPVLDNINHIMTACDSWLAYSAALGQWSAVINKPETAALNFNDSNIIGEIRVSATDITQSINQIEAKFPSKLNRDQYDYVYFKTPSNLLYPNEPVNKYTCTYEMTNDSVQAQYLANRTLEQAREDLIVSIKTTYNGIQINAGDVVTITNSAYGWTLKPFRVMKVNEASLPDGNLGAALELNEYNAAVYDDKSIQAYQPSPNSDLASPSYFSSLSAPALININTTATIPNFTAACSMPNVGRVTGLTLFYTTVSSPTVSDWNVWGTQTTTNSQPFDPSSTILFTDINLPTATYYFAIKVFNADYQSALSPLSTPFVWNPNPTTSAVAGTFVAQWEPVVVQVPRTGGVTPVFTGIAPQLYGTAAGGAINFVAAQTDADALFINNSWRIGSSSSTGYGSIVASGITIGSPTDGGTYAQFPTPTAQSTSPASLSVPVRYKDSTGAVTQGATAVLNFLFLDPGPAGPAGDDGKKAVVVNLYQWNTTTPTNPSGTSSFDWGSLTNSSYSGGGGWSVSIPSNPGIPNIQFWTASQTIIANVNATTTSVSWASGYTVQSVSANGANGANGTNGTNGINGLQSATATVYQWAATIPSGPAGAASYVWSTGNFGSAPSGWTLTPGTTPSVGYTLYQAQVKLLDSAAVTNTVFNWTSSSISALSYAGTNGSAGAQGASARICYTKTSLSALATTPTTITTSGNASFPPNDSWGTGTVWQATAPTYNAGESIYQSDGVYNPVTDQTVWNVPYISALKVGSLSSITTNTGILNVSGSISSSNGNFFVDSAGNVTIRNATSGARMTISNTQIVVYDANNVIRVIIGYLGP